MHRLVCVDSIISLQQYSLTMATKKRRQSEYRERGTGQGAGVMTGLGNFMLGAATLTLGAGVLGSISNIFHK